MISKQVAVKNETGLHARPAKEFVSKAKQFTSRITVRKGLEAEVNAKSIVMLMAACIGKGDTISITADGADERFRRWWRRWRTGLANKRALITVAR